MKEMAISEPLNLKFFWGEPCPHTPLVSSTIGGLRHYRKLTMHFINMIFKKLHKFNAS